MAWNEPGGSGDKDPWGRKRDQGPPDLDQVVKNLQNKIAGIFGGGGRRGGSARVGGSGGGLGAGLITGVAVALWLLSGLYIVQQGENAVVLRFGEKAEIAGPGLHWHWPFPIERKEIVNVEKVANLTLGYRRNEKGVGTVKVPSEALMLTQDENIISIEFAVQYKIKDAAEYLFNVSEPELTIAQAAESGVREVVGKSTLDYVLTGGRAEVEQTIKAILQTMLDRYKAGIYIVAVEMQEALPPEQVKAAFDDVVKAREDEQRLKNEAEAYFNDVVPRARGAAARITQEAQGYKGAVIARAEGDARRFAQIVSEYAKAPGVTRERMYIEAMEEMFSNTTKVLVDQKGSGNIMYLPLDKLMNRDETGPVNSLQPLGDSGDVETGPPQGMLRDANRDSLRRRGGGQ